MMFGLMNEVGSHSAGNTRELLANLDMAHTQPHDVPDINKWADSVQAVVTAIRKAGATQQIILIPGNEYVLILRSLVSQEASLLLRGTGQVVHANTSEPTPAGHRRSSSRPRAARPCSR